MKKKEFYFIAAIVVAALVLKIGMSAIRADDCAAIRITVNGEEYATYPLTEDAIISIHKTNVCEIKDGNAKMSHANCPDQLCMHQKPITQTGGTIVCLPNKIVIEGVKTAVSKDSSANFDAAT